MSNHLKSTRVQSIRLLPFRQSTRQLVIIFGQLIYSSKLVYYCHLTTASQLLQKH